MRTKPPASADAPPAVRPGERTVIHVPPGEVSQKTPRQLLRGRAATLVDVIAYAVLVSALLLGGFMALAYLFDQVKDWLLS